MDNYVDDSMVPKVQLPAVAQKLSDFGLPTKHPECASTLQLYKAGDGATHWAQRHAEEVSVPVELKKRKVPTLFVDGCALLQFIEENDLFGWHRLGQAGV